MPQPGDLIARKYQIERLLGRGGMGAVFEARHTIIQKSVALKWITPDLSTDPEFMHRLIREARAAGRVHHPNVLAVHDVGEHEGSLFLVMDHLRGMSLEALLANGPLPWPEALALLLPAMRGVHAAHLRGVLHRDLKPANIFICEDDQGNPLGPKVLDFGISKIVDSHYDDGASTQTGVQLGTPAYMSPEQLRGEKTSDERIDVYAFGVILYRVLSGRLPFTGATSSALAINAATTEAPKLASLCPDLPATLVAIVEKAMARDRSRRYPTVEALVTALEPLERARSSGGFPAGRASDHGGSMHTTTSGTASLVTARPGRGSGLVWAFAAVLAIAALVYWGATRSPVRESVTTNTASASGGLPNTVALPAGTASTTLATLPANTATSVTNSVNGVGADLHGEHRGGRPRPSQRPPRPATAPASPAPTATSTAKTDSPHLKTDDF
ncbi:MAG TPA: serine/threonine-protein kinase [Polyangiaceae bacterium]|jgi:serine/threonine-protein kinase|nr:serine/threonine-protein kinase [Polyangiaceae bacterium]